MEQKQFLYRLQLIPRLLDEANWTEKENNIVSTHFHYLQSLLQEKKVKMAGRTLNEDSTAFGIVILEVKSEEEAVRMMQNDPAVKEGVMTAELFPFRIALM